MTRAPHSQAPPRAVATRSFYESALDEADRAGLADAREVEGIGEEVALLRLQLRRQLAEEQPDPRLVQAGVRLLVQSLLAERRLSPQQADEVGEALAALLEEFGELLHEPDDEASEGARDA
jgi:hypothetical protein